MSSESKACGRRVRYRPGYTRPKPRPCAAGGGAKNVADFDVVVQIPENPPVTENEANAVELLLGSALRDFLMLNAKTPRMGRK